MDYSNKKCFIVTPIGGDNTDIRRAAEGVIDAVITPLLVELGFKESNITVAHRMPQPGSINKQVIDRVLNDDLVITNLTNLNPNVMYELATRHCARKPVIQICEEGTRLPFDIVEERTIFYKNDMLGVVQLRENLNKMVPLALADHKIDNPIYRVIQTNLIQASETIVDADKLILSRIDQMENMISSLVKSRLQTATSIEKNIINRIMNEFRIEISDSDKDIKKLKELIMHNISRYFEKDIDSIGVRSGTNNSFYLLIPSVGKIFVDEVEMALEAFLPDVNFVIEDLLY
ncbi:hypothetical protein [Paenibacillus alvei]|uniref:hypothetical protein n=1 Tax=Paenibacillus alvei TaxID=44250 RepID=UPI0018CD4ED1|nr:hypothetical protein [Paenibacillus alvei]MCY9579696.1 hypothetical protein [Paenibacillus alvei]MCY9586349.1 hypothetical protein [Paenibacillus alvei]